MGVSIHYTIRFEGDEDRYNAFLYQMKAEIEGREEFHDAEIAIRSGLCEFYKELCEIPHDNIRIVTMTEDGTEVMEDIPPMTWDFPVFEKALCITFPGCETFTVAPGRYWCKTQYSEDFSRHHPALVSVLDYLMDRGWAVEVNDETGYFESRDTRTMQGKKKFLDDMTERMAKRLEKIPRSEYKSDLDETNEREERRRLEKTIKAILSECGIEGIDPRNEKAAVRAIEEVAPGLADRISQARSARLDRDWKRLKPLIRELEDAAREILEELKEEEREKPEDTE